jgi:type II secretory pathway component GspD/PulD (secretin)
MMVVKLAFIPLLVLFAGSLSGCSHIEETRKKVDQQEVEAKTKLAVPVEIDQDRYRENKGSFIPAKALKGEKGAWLKDIKVNLIAKDAISMSQVIAKLSAQGINFATDMSTSLDQYMYIGKVNSTDAESALRLILGAAGLDYETDDQKKIVYIKPMSSRTWYINVGQKSASFQSNGGKQQGQGASGASGMSGSSGGGMSGSSGGYGGGTMGGGSDSMSGSSMGGGSSGGGMSGSSGGGRMGDGFVAQADFWKDFKTELTQRLKVLMPDSQSNNQSSPNQMQPQMGFGGGNGGQEASAGKTVGIYSINPETGSVTIQAPRWMLQELDEYIKRVQNMYNTDMTFSGEFVLLTADKNDSEGFDWSSFGKFSNSYGFAMQNNAMGGVTLSMPSDATNLIPSVTAGSQSVPGPLVGVQSKLDGIQLFSSYLSQIGKTSVFQKPVLTTTPGTPAEFRKTVSRYYYTITQNLAMSGLSGAASTATQNQQIEYEVGTTLKVLPRYDVAKGLVRAQMQIDQRIQSGSQTMPQVITYGTSSATINVTVPNLTKLWYSGEVLLKDGDVIIVGGQTDDNILTDENGLPILDYEGDTAPSGGLFGTKKANKQRGTYFFAIKVSIKRR